MKQRTFAVFLFLASCCSLYAAELGRFTIREPLGQDWTDEWIMREVDIGAPTNRVYVSDLRVVNEHGQAVPAQFYFNRRVLNEALRITRPMKLGVYLNLDLPKGRTAAFRVTDEGKSRQPPAQLYIIESGSKIFITNGIYQMEFDSANPQFVNAMRCGSVSGREEPSKRVSIRVLRDLDPASRCVISW